MLTPPSRPVAVPAAAEWWASIPLGGINGSGSYKGTPIASLIDGVLADSGGYSNVGGATDVGGAGISTSRKELVRPPPGTPNQHTSLGVLYERVC